MLGPIMSLTARGLFQPLFTVPALICTLRFPNEINSLATRVFKSAKFDIARWLQKPLACLAVVGAIIHTSRWLSRWTANNWTRDHSYDWKKEIVLITGGSSGIGLAMAKSFAAKGVKVVAIDVNEPPPDFPASSKFYKADVTSWEQVTEVASMIKTQVGNPTVLVNNAGITSRPLLLPTNTHHDHEQASDRLAYFERLVSINFTSHYRLALQFVPAMISANHGHVVTIASGMAFLGTSPSNEYCASKAACANLHDALAMELKYAHRATKVRNTIFFPAWVRTPLAQSRIDAGLIPEATVLEVDDVVEPVVGQVLSGESGGQVSIPSSLGFLAGLRAWPLWLQDLVKQIAFSRVTPRRPDLSTLEDVLRKGTR